jgi:hypothetical protein
LREETHFMPPVDSTSIFPEGHRQIPAVYIVMIRLLRLLGFPIPVFPDELVRFKSLKSWIKQPNCLFRFQCMLIYGNTLI